MTRRRRSVYLDDEQWAALAEMAKAEDRSVNGVVRRLVAEGLVRHSAQTRDAVMGEAARLLGIKR